MSIYTLEYFIKTSNKVHNFYYSYLKSTIINSITPTIITCPIHGDFLQKPTYHIHGSGCPKCAGNVPLSLDEFINKANKIHNFKYGYLNSIYVNSQTYMLITCPIHGDFKQKPNWHLSGNGCPKCANKHKTKEEFLAEAAYYYGNLYDYNKVIFKNMSTQIIVTCHKHGDFSIFPTDHISKLKKGCPKYGKESIKLSLEEFIERSNIIHNCKFCYSKVLLINAMTKIEIICPIHGSFWQTPNNHMNMKQGCPLCNIETRKVSLIDFIRRANINHDFKFSYIKTTFDTLLDNIIIICPIHGEFNQVAADHLRGAGCKKCKESIGEKAIRKYLLENNISFDDQYSFDDCRNILPLPFDFVVFDDAGYIIALIEYQGEQHYQQIKYWGEEGLKYQQLRDKIKADYCFKNNIPLIIIPYFKFKQINTILTEKLQ